MPTLRRSTLAALAKRACGMGSSSIARITIHRRTLFGGTPMPKDSLWKAINPPGVSPYEKRFKERFKRKMGVFRPSWPDFMCVRDGKLMCVEVKGGDDWVSENQRATFDLLAEHGIEVYIWHASFLDKFFPWSDVRKHWAGRDYRSKPLAGNLRSEKSRDAEEAFEEGGDSV
jgi:hypothetical protein